jgi:hypothetical protein
VTVIVGCTTVLVTGAPQPAVGVFAAVQVVGSGALVPLLGSTEYLLVTLPLAVGVTPMLMVFVPPLAAIELPLKVQVTVTGPVPVVGVQDQFVPAALVRLRPVGTASLTVAAVAAAPPLLVTVIV